jgi:hypothetical protein
LGLFFTTPEFWQSHLPEIPMQPFVEEIGF